MICLLPLTFFILFFAISCYKCFKIYNSFVFQTRGVHVEFLLPVLLESRFVPTSIHISVISKYTMVGWFVQKDLFQLVIPFYGEQLTDRLTD